MRNCWDTVAHTREEGEGGKSGTGSGGENEPESLEWKRIGWPKRKPRGWRQGAATVVEKHSHRNGH